MYLNKIYKQNGMTLTSWMVVISIALFFTMLSLKMVPAYLENYSIRQVLDGVKDDPSLRKKGRSELQKAIFRRFKINGVYTFDKKNIKFLKVRDGTEITVAYDVKKSVAGNVEVLMHFSDTVIVE